MSESHASEGGGEAEIELTDREEQLIDRVEEYFGEHRDDLERRHWVQALGTLGLFSSGTRELYRREVLETLPSLRYRTGDEEERWRPSWRPDREALPETLSGTSGFAALVALASIGGDRRAAEQPLLSLATAGVSLVQAVRSAARLVEEFDAGDVDASSSIETILSATAVPLVLPEAIRAVRKLVGK